MHKSIEGLSEGEVERFMASKVTEVPDGVSFEDLKEAGIEPNTPAAKFVETVLDITIVKPESD